MPEGHGVTHGGVGITEQVSLLLLAAIEHGNADAEGDTELAAVDDDGLADRG